jgi:hypothetical protein
MDKFVLLEDNAALEILNWRENLEPLNKAMNRRKSDWGWEDWRQWNPDVDPTVRDHWIKRETWLRAELKKMIATAYARQHAAR